MTLVSFFRRRAVIARVYGQKISTLLASLAHEAKSRHLVIQSLCYWILRRFLELAVLALRSKEAKEVEILVLRLWVPKTRSRGREAGFAQAAASRASACTEPRVGIRWTGLGWSFSSFSLEHFPSLAQQALLLCHVGVIQSQSRAICRVEEVVE
jgi:hypothetical protein